MARLLLLITFLIVQGLCPAVAQDTYPSRAITIVVSAPPGGPNDIVARALGEAMQRDLGQPVLVENRAGASGTIGTAFAARAAPDGYTLFIGTGSTHVVAPAMLKNVPYDPVKDFTPITLVGHASVVLLAGPSMPARTIAEVVAAARARPGQVSFGTTGPAAVYELAALTLEAIGGVRFNHVPYKGYAALVTDLAGGHIDLAVGSPDGNTLNPRIRTIAALGAKRIAARPDAPSAAESGYPGFAVPVWAGMYAPANTPRPIVQRLMAVMRAAMARPDVQARIRATGIEVEAGDDAALARLMADNLVTVRELMKKLNVVPE